MIASHACNAFCEPDADLHCDTFHLWGDTLTDGLPGPEQSLEYWRDWIGTNYGELVRWEPCEAPPGPAPVSRLIGQPQTWQGGFYLWWRAWTLPLPDEARIWKAAEAAQRTGLTPMPLPGGFTRLA